MVLIAVVVAGFASGVLSGVLGVGGAVLTTPAIRFLGAGPVAAVGSTVPAIIPGAITSTIRYARAGLVDRRIALLAGGPGMVTAALGTRVVDLVDPRGLMVATTLLVLWSGVSILRPARQVDADVVTNVDADVLSDADVLTDADVVAGVDPSAVRAGGETERRPGSNPLPFGARTAGGTLVRSLPSPETPLPGVVTADGCPSPAIGAGRPVVIGVVAGALAGVLGIGGGLVLLPAFTLVLRLPMKRAVATSLLAVSLMSTTALAGHWIGGHIDWRYALALTVGVVPGSRVGARVTLALSDTGMRRVCGLLLVLLALVSLGRELAAFL